MVGLYLDLICGYSLAEKSRRALVIKNMKSGELQNMVSVGLWK